MPHLGDGVVLWSCLCPFIILRVARSNTFSHQIDGAVFSMMTDAMLQENLGVTNALHRAKILAVHVRFKALA